MKYKVIKRVFLLCILFVNLNVCFSQETMLKGEIQKTVPDMFFGLWRVKSVRLQTDAPFIFKEKNVDMWNILLENNVVILSNPFTGANAKVKVDNSASNSLIFTKSGNYDGKILKDTVNISIEDDTFEGTDELELFTKSNVDGRVIKKETAIYSIKGEKLSW